MNRNPSALPLAIATALFAASTAFAAFIPPAGLELWLKADAITGVANGGAVSTWVDSTGLGGGRDVTQGTASYQPTYQASVVTGLGVTNPVVRFDGSNDVMANSASHNAQTIIYIAKSTANEGVAYGRLGTINEYFGFINAVGGTDGDLFLKNPQTYWTDSASQWLNTFHVFSGLYSDPANGSNGSIYFDRQLKATGSGGTSPVNLADDIGARGNLPGPTYNLFFKGDIAEVLVFSTNLSAVDRLSVEDYLIGKYIPEPASLALLGLGGLLVLRRRRARFGRTGSIPTGTTRTTSPRSLTSSPTGIIRTTSATAMAGKRSGASACCCTATACPSTARRARSGTAGDAANAAPQRSEAQHG